MLRKDTEIGATISREFVIASFMMDNNGKYSKLTALFADLQDVRAYADLNGFRFNESPQEIIPSTVLITPYRPDLILYNSHSSLMGIIELTCPLDSRQHLESAHCPVADPEGFLGFRQKPPFKFLLSGILLSIHKQQFVLSNNYHWAKSSMSACR